MNPKTAAKWVEAHEHCQKTRAPSVLAKYAEGKYKAAVRVLLDNPKKTKIRMPRGAKSKPKSKSIPWLKKELDRVFSIYTRTKDADENGMVSCVTCGRRDHWKNMDAGHYVPRQDMAVRWDPRNVWPQCRPDNAWRGGEPEKMAIYIDETCGVGTAANLRGLARYPFKLKRDWMESCIAFYKSLIGEAPALPEPPAAKPSPSHPNPPNPNQGI